LAAYAAAGLLAETPGHVQTFPLRDTTGLIVSKAKVEAVNYLGRECVRVTVEGDDCDGLALLPGADFQDGVIEADVALKVTTPPGVRDPGFFGIAFRVGPDASHYELFYLRPGNADAPDQAMRNHAVQYVSGPDYGWYKLRREWPSIDGEGDDRTNCIGGEKKFSSRIDGDRAAVTRVAWKRKR
jgi:hypothetical protein